MEHIPVLVYHRVTRNGEGEPSEFVVNVKTFERQLRYYAKRKFRSMSLDEALESPAMRKRGGRRFLITFDDGYSDNLENAVPLLIKYGFSAIVFVIPNFTRITDTWNADIGPGSAKLLTASQVLELKKLGFEIGGHSWSHPSLPSLDDQGLERELRTCKSALEGLLGEPLRSFAYPFGETDERVISATKRAGYSCAFATNSGPMHLRDAPFRIRRTRIENHSSSFYLFIKLSGIEKLLRIIFLALKGLLGARPGKAAGTAT